MRIVACIIVLFATASPAPTPRNGLEALQGVWRFQNEVDTGPDGSVVNIGPHDGYRGLLVYTSDGYLSGTMIPNGRRWTVGQAVTAAPPGRLELPTFSLGK
jgi:hypothetical protein